MVFYAVLLMLSCSIPLLAMYGDARTGIKVCLSVVLILGLVASIRGFVGTDTLSYHHQYNWIVDYSDSEYEGFRVEPAFYGLGKLIGYFGGNSYAYVFLIGVIQATFLVYLLLKIENPIVFLVFYVSAFYINFHFNILRAGSATLIVLISMLHLRDRDGKKFYGLLWSSILFHYTAIFAIVYITIYRQLLERQYKRIAYVLLSVVVFVLIVLPFFGEFLFDKYGFYLDQNLEDSVGYGVGFFVLMFSYIALGIAMYVNGMKLEVFYILIPFLIVRLFALNYPILGRVEAYLLPILLLCINQVRWRVNGLILILLSISFLNMYGTLTQLSVSDSLINDVEHSGSPYIPYNTFFMINDDLGY
ncbi:MAG: EpsG family protein [Bacteroidota bacterium]